jgi:Calcium-activated chloride channel
VEVLLPYFLSAACFHEFWKRQEALITWEWDLETDDSEEETRPEFEVVINTTVLL